MPNPLSRRRPTSTPDDPTLAEDLLGVPKPTGSVETIDSTDPVAARTGDDDELGRLLAARAPRAHIPWVTAVLAAAVLLAVGYVAGGYHYRNSGGSSGGSGLAAARAGRAAGAEGGFAGFGGGTRTGTGTGAGAGAGVTGGFGAAGGATIGTVKLVDGNNVYLTTTAGATVKVTLGKGAKVTVTKAGKLTDLAPGTSIVVLGTTGADGTVTATSVSEGAAGGFGGRGAAAGG
jgi:hypothetical protein